MPPTAQPRACCTRFRRAPYADLVRRAEILLGVIVVAVFGFIAGQAVQVRRLSVESRARSNAADTVSAPAVYEPTGGPAIAEVTDNVLRGGEEIRNAIELNRSRTYMSALLDQRDSTVRRWPLSTARPIRVWIDDPRKTRGGLAGGERYVRQAFDDWTVVGIPVRFEMVKDSARSDVAVVWRETLAEKRVGVTQMHGVNDFYTHGAILLATHRPSGELLLPGQVSSTVLHEVGHLLGLGHADDTASVMFPEMKDEIRARRIAETDRVTLQLLYRLPVGRVQ